MDESHSTVLVQQAIAATQRYLEAQARGELPTVPTLPDGRGIGLAHRLNQVLRHLNLHISRATIHDNAMHETRRGYNPIVKGIALGAILQVQADPSEFDAVYDALHDEDSRDTFDWFISYGTALAFLGQDADEVVPGIMTTAAWQRALDQAGKTFVGGAYHIDGVTVDTLLGELVLTFFLEQYRLKDIVEPRNADVVLDCGAYKGETALWFARQVGKEGRVVAFEPAAHNLEGLRRNLAANRSMNMAPVTVLECALSNSAGMLHFNAQAGDGSHVDAESTESVPAVTIDDVVEQQHLGRVDFIKMDIEGGEVDALRGADETLRKFAPRLAISVYHRPHDLPDIVTLILQACPDYRLYLSHKSPGWADTVLFAKRGDLS